MSSTVAVKAFAEGVTQQIKEHLPDEYRILWKEIQVIRQSFQLCQYASVITSLATLYSF